MHVIEPPSLVTFKCLVHSYSISQYTSYPVSTVQGMVFTTKHVMLMIRHTVTHKSNNITKVTFIIIIIIIISSSSSISLIL